MIEWITWIAADAWRYAWFLSALTFSGGVMIGRAGKTNKLERKVRETQQALDAVLTTIELKSGGCG